MKEMAESYLRENVTSTIITIPAYFNEAQRNAMKEAAVMAGLHVERIMDEPTIAAIAQARLLHPFVPHFVKKVKALVFDLDGGTLDTRVVAVEHDNVFKKHKVNITEDKEALKKLVRECEWAKLGLSSRDWVWVEVVFQGFHSSEEVTRATFEELNADLFEMMLGSIERVVEDSHLKKSNIDTIVLSGGSAKIPRVRELVMEFFEGKET
ncbi:heat shock 70 kDa protein [Striga asiatica]|uniref:Heat shock 70 kDa protein n=1 Tax=Striga asiatica TaxID=4170 RepID=A0A5A7NWR7_STRAF|nr:heat shock 70 kDa protein [Striga asiatica]